MRHLKNRNIVPPGGWRYTVRQTGAVLDANDFDSLVALVSQHLSVNRIEISSPDALTLAQIIEDEICRSVPPSFSYADGQVMQASFNAKPKVFIPSIARQLGNNTLNRTLHVITLAKRSRVTFPALTAEQINDRAMRMMNCPYKLPSRVCYSCGPIGPVDQAFGASLRTAHDPRLEVCGVFGAYMRGLIHIPAFVLLDLLSASMLAQFNSAFWLLPEWAGNQKESSDHGDN